MTLDEAIKHAEEVAEENEKFCYKKGGKGGYFNEDIDWNNTKCAEEHRQLAEWLKELKSHREAWGGMKEGLLEMSRLHEYVSIKHMIQLIDEARPKEGDADDD